MYLYFDSYRIPVDDRSDPSASNHNYIMSRDDMSKLLHKARKFASSHQAGHELALAIGSLEASLSRYSIKLGDPCVVSKWDELWPLADGISQKSPGDQGIWVRSSMQTTSDLLKSGANNWGWKDRSAGSGSLSRLSAADKIVLGVGSVALGIGALWAFSKLFDDD